MNDNDTREHGVGSRTASLYKPLTAAELLAKTHSDIRQEYRKMPNPPAKDTRAAK